MGKILYSRWSGIWVLVPPSIIGTAGPRGSVSRIYPLVEKCLQNSHRRKNRIEVYMRLWSRFCLDAKIFSAHDFFSHQHAQNDFFIWCVQCAFCNLVFCRESSRPMFIVGWNWMHCCVEKLSAENTMHRDIRLPPRNITTQVTSSSPLQPCPSFLPLLVTIYVHRLHIFGW